MNLSEDPRAGLELIRYHSWATHRKQSNGEHSAQIARILLTVWPDCPRRMIVHCITHDIGEMAGDVQYPYKKRVPGLKENMDAAEQLVRSEMRRVFGLPPDLQLTDYEQRVFKFCEFLEMWEFGLREVNMGNAYGGIIATRCLVEANAIYEKMEPPPGCPDIRPGARIYIDRRARWEMRGTGGDGSEQ